MIAIIGLMMGLILPAVQAARESARKSTCRNHLKQLGTALLLHLETHKHLPTNGWGHAWVGDPDRGFGPHQPGGWVYNVLPYMEAGNLRRVGRHMQWNAKKVALEEMLTQPLEVFHCPSRRRARPYPYRATGYPFRNAVTPPRVAKSDYAVSGGDNRVEAGTGPPGPSPRDLRQYQWPDAKGVTGVSFVRTTIRPNQLRDGATYTYLIGEKYISLDEYDAPDEGSGGDDQAMYIGDDADIRRWTMSPPMPDARRLGTRHEFGSAHSGGCHFVLCDGSVHTIRYDIDAEVHRRLGNRHDGLPVDRSAF